MTEITGAPTLTTLRSSTAAKSELLAYNEYRLQTLRLQLEAVTISDDDARILRGRIAELKNLTKLVNNRPTDD